jgi:hypothetical protein
MQLGLNSEDLEDSLTKCNSPFQYCTFRLVSISKCNYHNGMDMKHARIRVVPIASHSLGLRDCRCALGVKKLHLTPGTVAQNTRSTSFLQLSPALALICCTLV